MTEVTHRRKQSGVDGDRTVQWKEQDAVDFLKQVYYSSFCYCDKMSETDYFMKKTV